MRFRIKFLPLALSVLLTGCATIPSPKPSDSSHPSVAVSPPPTTPQPTSPPPTIEKPSPSPVAVTDVWDRLRDSFAMADCDSDPAVSRWARRFTHNRKGFEGQLKAVLPRLVYVEKIAARYEVPGEFALIPWVESRFRPVAGRRNRPAGMWQIMPVTAGAMGLRVDGRYDGRMDIPAAANAVMKLLAQYHEQFHDWRVVDYAYNAGEFSIRRIIRKHGMPPAEPVIPNWPVRKVTREHLTKLLAIACVVRDPARFKVTLPTLPETQRLVKVDIPRTMSLARAADHAGLSVGILKDLNSAFRGKRLDAEAVDYLMLPASHAKQFKEAASPLSPATALGDRATGSAEDNGAKPSKRTHAVRPGESLWTISRNYHVKIEELKRWNHLGGSMLRPGQILRINDTP